MKIKKKQILPPCLKEVEKFANLIDHTLLRPDAREKDIKKLCEEAKKYGFATVCVQPLYVAFSAHLLRGSPVKVCSVVGFPLGGTSSIIKAIEARELIASGAEEIDMVLNIGALKAGVDKVVLNELKIVREATEGKVLKVIIETGYLNRSEKIRACQLAKKAKADFVKTSTGFGPQGAKIEDVRLMRKVVGSRMGVKAAGGIRTLKDLKAFVKAGASRIGTSAAMEIFGLK